MAGKKHREKKASPEVIDIAIEMIKKAIEIGEWGSISSYLDAARERAAMADMEKVPWDCKIRFETPTGVKYQPWIVPEFVIDHIWGKAIPSMLQEERLVEIWKARSGGTQ